MSQTPTFASLVDAASQQAKDRAAPFTPSPAQYEASLREVCLMIQSFTRPWDFIKATHRGAGTMDTLTSELFKRLNA